MKTVPSADTGDAVERLQDEQWRILELLDAYARHQREPQPRPQEAARLASLICMLLRVHSELERMLLHPALALGPGAAAAVARATAWRHAMLHALERAEAVSPRDRAHALEMAALAGHARAWIRVDELEIFALVRRSRLDLAALDREMATRQQALLSAARNAADLEASRPAVLGPSLVGAGPVMRR